MCTNPHLKPQLDAYLALERPGFAILIDAPWGVGKTWAVADWLRGLGTAAPKHLMTSLYGVGNRSDVENAIYLSRLDDLGGKTAQDIARLAGLAGQSLATFLRIRNDASVASLGLRKLPELLIFDDLERAGMPPGEMLSLLNTFVEHEERHVILIANLDELRARDRAKDADFGRIREKVIGRIIGIGPDTAPALQAFLGKLPKGGAGEFIGQEQDTVLRAFKASGMQNLRLLRQALFEFDRLWRLIPEPLRSHHQSMRPVLASFLVLAVAYHGGVLDEEGLKQQSDWARAIWETGGRKGEEPPKPQIDLLRASVAEAADLINLEGRVITGTLAAHFIGKGHADPALVTRELSHLGPLRGAGEDPLRQLYDWRSRPVEHVEPALAEVRARMTAGTLDKAREILHVGGILCRMAEAGALPETPADVVAVMKRHIDGMASKGRLAPTGPSEVMERAVSHHFKRLDFPSDNDWFKQVRGHLVATLDRLFWEMNPKRMRHLIDLIDSEPGKAGAVLAGHPVEGDFAHCHNQPVLRDLDPEVFVDKLLSLSPDLAGSIARSIGDRYRAFNPAQFAEEMPVWCKVRARLEAGAGATENKIRAAQIRDLIGFLPKPAEDPAR